MPELFPHLLNVALATGIYTGVPYSVSFSPKNNCMRTRSHSLLPFNFEEPGGAANSIKCGRSETNYHAR